MDMIILQPTFPYKNENEAKKKKSKHKKYFTYTGYHYYNNRLHFPPHEDATGVMHIH